MDRPPKPVPGVFVERVTSRTIEIRWSSRVSFRKYFVTITPISGGGGAPRIHRLTFDQPVDGGELALRNLDAATEYRIIVQGIDGLEFGREGRHAARIRRSVRQRIIGAINVLTDEGGIGD